MAEMGLEYGFKGQAGMGKGGYTSRFGDKRAWVCVCAYRGGSGGKIHTTVHLPRARRARSAPYLRAAQGPRG